jgi:ssDNA-binding Zn-finger/Zn-ribbon topoisomerase 1
VQLRKVEHPNGKSFYWACNGPDCPYESEEIKYTMDNYHATPPLACPRCGRDGNQQANSGILTEGAPLGQQPTKSTVSPGEVGHWNHPDRE